MNRDMIVLCLWAACVLTASHALAGTEPQRFEAADSQGVQATRGDNAVYLQIEQGVTGPITIPRLAASLRSMQWEGSDDAGGLRLRPEQETWVINWEDRPKGATRLVLEFDGPPLLMSEVQPISASGDGSFYLPAHLAQILGDKIRYEPQPFKNTVGYWVGTEDAAIWTVRLEEPGRFNVAVLQGCGSGQGGSQALVSFQRPGETIEDATLDFEVVETGHFQNFRWVHLGEVELTNPGEMRIAVMPKQIKKAALMDVRAIHLIRLPD